jgi:PAS domain S-box-containing protein
MTRSKKADQEQPSDPPLTNAERAAFLDAILESPTGCSIVALNLDGVILIWNEGARRLYGYSATEAVGKNHLFLHAPEDVASGLAGTILQSARRAGRWIGDVRRIRKDESRFTSHMIMTLRRSASGEAQGFTMISTETTETAPSRRKLDLPPATADRRESRILESAEMFRQLAESGDQVFFVYTPDHRTTLYASPSYAQIWGRSCESLYQNPLSWLEAVHPLDRDRVRATITAEDRVPRDIQYRIVRPDGTMRWILARVEEIKDAFGAVKRICAVALDITDLRSAQSEVAKSEIKYRRLFESAKDGILILDAATGKITEINPFLLELLGYCSADCVGKQVWELGFFEDIEKGKRLVKTLQETKYIRYEDSPLKTKDGRTIPVECVCNVYAAGDRSVIQCNIRDITERKRTEKSLRRLASIVDNSCDAIVGLSLDCIVQSWNGAAERLFGYTAKEIVGDTITRLCPVDRIKEHASLLDSLRDGDNLKSLETIRLSKSGKALDVALSVTLLRNSAGEPEGFSGVYRDIAESKQLEARLRQSQKMEGIGRLAGGIAHDFNNLLTAIMGYGEFLIEKLPASDPRRNDAAEILKAGDRATTLTRQLLAFSSQQVMEYKILDINAVLGDLEKMLRRIIGEHIELSFHPGVEVGLVKADPGQITQIAMNLCLNAKDAMPEGGKLLIETANVELGLDYTRSHPPVKAGRHTMIAVSDTGCGMSADVLSHLFEPFFTTKEQGKGTGLGLSSSRFICRRWKAA